MQILAMRNLDKFDKRDKLAFSEIYSRFGGPLFVLQEEC